MNPRKKPSFIRQGGTYLKRLHRKWRRPKGNQNKLRMHIKAKGNRPNPGYGSPIMLRYLHPSGLREVLVNNVSQLKSLDPKTDACRIATGVGRRTRIELMKLSKEMNITVLNPLREEKR